MNAKKLTPEQKEVCEQSLIVVRNIDTLARLDEFKAFMDRIKRRADELANEVLHDDMKPKEREKRRNHRLGLLEVLGIPKDDREASVRILAQYGISPGDPLDD